MADSIEMERTKKIVIVGAGFAGLEAALRLDRQIAKSEFSREVSILLVDRNVFHTLRPKLPEAIGGRVACAVNIPLERILQGTNIGFLQGDLEKVDSQRGVLIVNGQEIRFWRLLLAAGSVPDFEGLPETSRSWPIPVWDFAGACNVRKRSEIMVQLASRKKKEAAGVLPELKFVVAGGGFVGAETAAEQADRLRRLTAASGLRGSAEVVLVEQEERVLPRGSIKASRLVEKRLEQLGVKRVTGARIIRIERNGVELSDGQRIDAATVIWAGGVLGSAREEWSAVPVRKGRLVTGTDLSVSGTDNMFAAGDIAWVQGWSERFQEPSAHRAQQHGRLAAENILADLQGIPRVDLQPSPPIYNLGLGRMHAVMDMPGKLLLHGAIPALGKQAVMARHLYGAGGYALLRQVWRPLLLNSLASEKWDGQPFEEGNPLSAEPLPADS